MEITEYSRVLGCMYGMATGDALGVPSSFQTRSQIKEKWGWIDTFYPPEKGHIFHEGLKPGEYTDDTEQALALARSFMRNRRVVPQDVVDEIIKWADRVRNKYTSPLGPSTERALKAIKQGEPIEESGKFGVTNGSAMRISPLGIIHGLKKSTLETLVRDVHLTCLPTHNTSVSIAAAASVAWGVALCIRGEANIEVIIGETMKAAEIGAQYGNVVSAPDIPTRIRFICDMIKLTDNHERTLDKVYEMFGGGDLAADSVPVAIGMFVLGKGNPKIVNEFAVNLGGDCDTNAAIAGAMAGAYSGVDAVPQAWRRKVDEMNQDNLAEIARQLIELTPYWQDAGEK